MNYSIEFKDFQPPETAREMVDDLVKRIERKGKDLATFLRVMVEQNSPHRVFRASLTLEAPGKTVAAKEDGHELEPVIRSAFAEIERQFLEYKALRRGEHLWKRLTTRKEILPSRIDHEAFFYLVRPHLEGLSDFVAHELAYAEAVGDLAAGELTVQDVVDEALLSAYREFIKDPARGELRSWLINLAMDRLDAEIHRLKGERSTAVPIGEDVPEQVPIYQSDEDLRVEDIVPDIELPTSPYGAARRELRQCVRDGLLKMRKECRRLLVIHHVQGLSGSELARAVGGDERGIEGALEYAGRYLRDRLLESGCRFIARDTLTRTAR